MATGDTSDFIGRIKAALPARWFPSTSPVGTIPGDGIGTQFTLGVAPIGPTITVTTPTVTPVLDALLTGLSYTWSWFYSLYAYVNLQTRLATSTDVWLDIAAEDFLGGSIFRKPGQSDALFSTRIRKEIVRTRDTRAGLIQALVDLTGRTPTVFEPARATDTGGLGFIGMTAGTGLEYGGTGYAGAGGYGSLALPFQCFVTALRPFGGGIANVAGYYLGSGWAGGGYGVGAIEFGNLAMSLGQITDTDIDNAIVSVMPAATIAWTNISN